MTNESDIASGPGRPGRRALWIAFAAGGVLLAIAGGFVAYRLYQGQPADRDWKPGEVVVGSERVARSISGLPPRGAPGVNAADVSALWLAAFEAVQSGACARVTGGGVKAPSAADSPGVYFISCGMSVSDETGLHWFRQDEHGVEACTDALSCLAN